MLEVGGLTLYERLAPDGIQCQLVCPLCLIGLVPTKELAQVLVAEGLIER